MTEEQILKRNFNLDCEFQHLKHYHEGYKECVITLINGGDIAFKKYGIDPHRYHDGGAKRFSYNEGWKQAESDLNI